MQLARGDGPIDPGEFDEKSVKLGQMKDPDKIAAKIQADREKHADTVAAFANKMRQFRMEQYAKAALSARTGRVLAIGYMMFEIGDQNSAIEWVDDVSSKDERDLVGTFWEFFLDHKADHYFLGHNIIGFDVPFLMQRSFVLGLNPPSEFHAVPRYSPRFVDTAHYWGAGKYPKEYISLEDLCFVLGLDMKKTADGAMFYEMFEQEPNKAREYCLNDLHMTLACAERMRIF